MASFFHFPCLLQPHHSSTITFLLCVCVHGIGYGVVSPFFCGTFPLPFPCKKRLILVLPIILPLETSANEVNFFSFNKYFILFSMYFHFMFLVLYVCLFNKKFVHFFVSIFVILYIFLFNTFSFGCSFG